MYVYTRTVAFESGVVFSVLRGAELSRGGEGGSINNYGGTGVKTSAVGCLTHIRRGRELHAREGRTKRVSKVVVPCDMIHSRETYSYGGTNQANPNQRPTKEKKITYGDTKKHLLLELGSTRDIFSSGWTIMCT